MKSRYNRLNLLNLELAKKYNDKFMDAIIDFIPEEYVDGYLVGHTNNYIKVKVVGDKEKIGQMLEIKITETNFPTCIGKII